MQNQGRRVLYENKSQRNFEGELMRYKSVLVKEKKKHGVLQKEAELSKNSNHTMDPTKY